MLPGGLCTHLTYLYTLQEPLPHEIAYGRQALSKLSGLLAQLQAEAQQQLRCLQVLLPMLGAQVGLLCSCAFLPSQLALRSQLPGALLTLCMHLEGGTALHPAAESESSPVSGCTLCRWPSSRPSRQG